MHAIALSFVLWATYQCYELNLMHEVHVVEKHVATAESWWMTQWFLAQSTAPTVTLHRKFLAQRAFPHTSH